MDPAARARFDRDVIEKQFLQGLALTSIVERRGSAVVKERLFELASTFDAGAATDADFRTFERQFWSLAAVEGGNRILRIEVSWWYGVLAHVPAEPQTSAAPMESRIGFYRELARRLSEGGDASAYYLQVVTPILELLFRERVEGSSS